MTGRAKLAQRAALSTLRATQHSALRARRAAYSHMWARLVATTASLVSTKDRAAQPNAFNAQLVISRLIMLRSLVMRVELTVSVTQRAQKHAHRVVALMRSVDTPRTARQLSLNANQFHWRASRARGARGQRAQSRAAAVNRSAHVCQNGKARATCSRQLSAQHLGAVARPAMSTYGSRSKYAWRTYLAP